MYVCSSVTKYGPEGFVSSFKKTNLTSIIFISHNKKNFLPFFLLMYKKNYSAFSYILCVIIICIYYLYMYIKYDTV